MPSLLGKLDRNTSAFIGFLNLSLVGVVETFSESETLPSKELSENSTGMGMNFLFSSNS